MNPLTSILTAVLLLNTLVVASAQQQQPKVVTPSVVTVSPGPNAQFDFQAALINAVPGDVIELTAGHYDFRSEINVTCDNITIRGAGQQKTILSFKNQTVGSSGIIATGNAFVIENLAVEDTAGNAIKVLGSRDVTFRGVRVEWTRGPNSENGAYGIYPVECQNVLIENCASIAASDAGIYVGQSQDVIVKGCVARKNVAGIEIENTLRADVFENSVTDNTGGILVFDLPGLNLKNGKQVRVFNNKVIENNHENFAPKGTVVADVPAGTGVMLMATDDVEIFDNDIKGHDTSNVIVVSFLVTQRKLNDPEFDPYPEGFSIHDNRISNGGQKPSGSIGLLLAPVVGTPFPDIFYDGITDKGKLVDGKLPKKFQSDIRDNGDATFADVDLANFSPTNVLTGKYKVDRDISSLRADKTPLPDVTLQPHSKAVVNGNPAASVYRSAPEKLSGWELFELRDGRFVAAAGVLNYDLNTPLFSDYAAKHRFVRLPDGRPMVWDDTEAFKFPDETVIAKTFAYPDDSKDHTPGERFLETRIEVRRNGDWYGFSYVWNKEQTDAELKLGGGQLNVSWTDDSGTKRDNVYQIPNANQCLSCHSSDGKFVPLGTTARNLNRPAPKGGHNQLEHWIANGALTDAPEATRRPILARFDDPSPSLDDRARAYLEVNCAHCHNPKGSARTSGLDLSTAQNAPAKFGVFKSPVAAGKGSGGRKYDIVPGKPDESILLYRIETNDVGARMPNLGRNLVHVEAVALIRDWIKQMPAAQQPK